MIQYTILKNFNPLMKRFQLFILLIITATNLTGQENLVYYKGSTFASFSSGENTPFWLVNHNWGTSSLKSDNFYIRASVFQDNRLNKDWSYKIGLDIIGGNNNNYGNIWLQQLFLKLNWKSWRLDIGSQEDYTSLLDSNLSSGEFIKSNHARPTPEIRLSIPEFILLPYTKGNMYIKGEFSMGYQLDSKWQEKTAKKELKNYVTETLTHNKSIYFRFGNLLTKNKMQFTFGLSHATYWGGKLHKYRQIDGKWQYIEQKQPKGLDDFLRVMVAKEGSSSSSDADKAYVAGSQWGAYMFKYDYKIKNDVVLSLYINHFFDDGSGLAFENYRDNLLGIQYKTNKKSILSGAVFEYIYTKNQTGPIHHNLAMDDEHKHLKHKGNGNDNYYNNADYSQGPSHFGKSMGTPLFLSPEYNKDGYVNFKSNRIIALHLAFEGYFSSLFYRVLLTTGQSWGRYYLPFTHVKDGFASQIELTYSPSKIIEDFDIKLSLGYDNGEFFGGNTFGGSLTLIKNGFLYKK